MQPAGPPSPPVTVQMLVAAWRAGGLSRRERLRRTDVTPGPSQPAAPRRVTLRPRRA
jgi:hypothetical protein